MAAGGEQESRCRAAELPFGRASRHQSVNDRDADEQLSGPPPHTHTTPSLTPFQTRTRSLSRPPPSVHNFFQPSSDLEKGVAALLESHGLSDKQVALSEQLALADVDEEEVKRRTAELRKMRDVLFHHERNLKRASKIKSKAYRKSHKKEKASSVLACGVAPQSRDPMASFLGRSLPQSNQPQRMDGDHLCGSVGGRQTSLLNGIEGGSVDGYSWHLLNHLL